MCCCKHLCILKKSNKFDSSFSAATVFFTFMYIPEDKRGDVINEAYRVLKSGGEMMIWGLSAPELSQNEEDIIVLPLEIDINGQKTETGYGYPKSRRIASMTEYIVLFKTAGFKIIESRLNDNVFFLHLKK